MLADRSGDLWAGTLGGGLARVHAGAITRYTTREGLGSDSVLALYEDGDGELWVGTYGGGLSLRQGERFVSAARRDGFVADSVGAMVEDDFGHLWMSTDQGLVRAPRTELAERLTGRRRSVAVETFGAADGLVGELGTGYTPAAWKARDGRLWFATRRGAAVVDPRSLEGDRPPPPLALEELLADHREVDLRSPPVLPAGTFDLEIRYTALSFAAPERVRFRYRLEGFDPGWVEAADRRVAYYTNLPPGRYRFRVAAADGEGAWSPEPASLDLRLLPRWYQTAWFRLALAAAALLAAYGLYRLRVGHLEARAAVAEERNRLARDIHDTIAQDLTAILMQTRAAQREAAGEPAGVRGRLERIGGFAERGLEEARRSLRALRPQVLEGRDLAGALQEAARNLGAGEQTRIEVRARGERRPLRPAVEAELLRIGGEAMANAVQHAGATRIEVDLAVGRRKAVLTVRDDGCGFDAAAVGGATGAGRFGLVGMRERAERVAGRLEVTSAPGAGTRVEVRVPLSGGGR